MAEYTQAHAIDPLRSRARPDVRFRTSIATQQGNLLMDLSTSFRILTTLGCSSPTIDFTEPVLEEGICERWQLRTHHPVCGALVIEAGGDTIEEAAHALARVAARCVKAGANEQSRKLTKAVEIAKAVAESSASAVPSKEAPGSNPTRPAPGQPRTTERKDASQQPKWPSQEPVTSVEVPAASVPAAPAVPAAPEPPRPDAVPRGSLPSPEEIFKTGKGNPARNGDPVPLEAYLKMISHARTQSDVDDMRKVYEKWNQQWGAAGSERGFSALCEAERRVAASQAEGKP